MPVYEAEKKGWGWPAYVAVGCGGCLVLLLVVPFVGGLVAMLFMGRTMHTAVQQAANPTPIKRTGPYDYGYWSESATVAISLPGGNGQLTYGHYLLDPKLSTGGQRGLRLSVSGGRQEWPLQYSPQSSVKVGTYWHPAKGGKGPFVRFCDATGESALDLQRREVGSVGRSAGHAYLCNYAYDNTSFQSSGPMTATVNGKTITTFKSANGTPAPDVTAALSSSNCKYLGSIVRKGNKLVFVPATGKKP